MKWIKQITTLAAAIALAISAQAAKYTISISFADASLNGSNAVLTSYDSGDTLATTQVKGSKAAFTGFVEDTYMARIIAGGRRVELIVENGNIAVNWATGVATGTPLNERLNAIASQLDDIQKQASQLSAQAKQDAITTEQHEAAAARLEKQYSNCWLTALMQNTDNGIGPWALSNYLMENEFSSSQIDSLLSTLPPNYRSLKRVAKAVAAVKAKETTNEGKHFTDFAVTGEDGNEQRLSHYAGRGKYVLVDFWASWCGPCRREITRLKKIYPQVKDKMEFVGVAVWDKPADTHRAVEQMKIPWPLIIGNKALTVPTDLYGILGIPCIVIIDPNGTIVSRGLQGDDLDAKIKQLLAK